MIAPPHRITSTLAYANSSPLLRQILNTDRAVSFDQQPNGQCIGLDDRGAARAKTAKITHCRATSATIIDGALQDAAALLFNAIEVFVVTEPLLYRRLDEGFAETAVGIVAHHDGTAGAVK